VADSPQGSLNDRSAIGRLRLSLPPRDLLVPEAMAGLSGGIASVPDGMATAILVGVNPVLGLYASFSGRLTGGLTASTQRMIVTTTSAAALAAGSALASTPASQRESSVVLLSLIAGLLMVGAGVLKLGRYTRFVSNSVMTGFLTGVAINIILGQVPDMTGAAAVGSTPLAKAFDVLTSPGRIELASLLVGLFAILLMVVISASRHAIVASLLAIIIPTLGATLLGADVARVADAGPIPSGLPLPHLPDLSQLSLGLITGALSVAAIVLVQGAGVAESAPNLEDEPSSPNQDFVAQGIGNLASGLFGGQPVGGSVGMTALNVGAGARTRWSAIFSGLWLLLILVALSGVVGNVAEPTLSAILIVSAAASLRPQAVLMILRTGPVSQIALVATFLATLLLPVAEAVFVGVALSIILQLNREALDLRVIELELLDDGRFVDLGRPTELHSRRTTILDVYGSLYYAGARTLQANLPDPSGLDAPVVIIRMRGRTDLGSTSVVVLSEYARRLELAGGRLYLTGLDPTVVGQLRRTGRLDPEDNVRVFLADPILGESSRAAYRDAQAWLASLA
jgi:sulfate permease, SulP family